MVFYQFEPMTAVLRLAAHAGTHLRRAMHAQHVAGSLAGLDPGSVPPCYYAKGNFCLDHNATTPVPLQMPSGDYPLTAHATLP